MTLILKNLNRIINNQWIIRDLSFEVLNGECLALLGPSGCGKSSTLRLIAGLDKPTGGSIYIDQLDITSISASDRKIGMVFQSYALYPHLSVLKNLTLGLKARKLPDSEQKNKVWSVLSIMQLEDFAERKPSELSGGQRQRVALARALLREPNVYLLDEPMSNLDAQLREELRPELRRLILSGGQPVVYVTHDQEEAMAMASRIAVLNNGSLEQIGTPKELYSKPLSLFVAKFIGRPQINILNNQSNEIVAIRPEDINLQEGGINCKLVHQEWLGKNQLWQLQSDYGLIRMLNESDIDVPENITIGWQSTKEHHFSLKTGKRIN